MNILDYLFAESVMTDETSCAKADQDFILDESICQQDNVTIDNANLTLLGAMINSVFHAVETTDSIIVDCENVSKTDVFDFNSGLLPLH
jgi:hypothetical protein